MKIGMNLLLWTTSVEDEHLPIIEWLKEVGYDGVELPILQPDERKYQALGRQLDDLGILRTAVTIRTLQDNPISADRSIRERALERTNATLDSCAAAGVELLCGPFHSALGVFSGHGPSRDEWQWGIESMRMVAEHAERVGVTLALEPLNRFECYLLNSAHDGARFVREVNHPRVKLMYDTFHAHIEEKQCGEALRSCADVLCHVHISENDRSTPGLGSVHWETTFAALREIRYDGWLMVEAFGLAHPDLAAAAKIWRRLFDNERQLAEDAIRFIRSALPKRVV
jgi:D-psicose/D-tagatose/L-ribulose 3-epimerase